MRAEPARVMSSPTERERASGPGSRWPWLVAVCLFVVTLLWTGGLALSHDKALNDRLNYHLTARTLASGGGLAVPAKSDLRVPDTSAPYVVGERPLFPFLASLAIRLAGPSVEVTNLVSALMRALTLLPIFALALRLFGRWTAIGTALLYVLSPPWTGLGATTMTGTTFAFFYYLTLLLAVVYWQRPSRLFALLTGMAFTLTIMAREEGQILGLALVAILLWRGNLDRSRKAAGDTRESSTGLQAWLARYWSFVVRGLSPDLAFFLIAPLLGYAGQKIYLWHTFGSLSSAAHPLLFNSLYEYLYALRLQTRQEYFQSIGGLGGAIAVRVFNNVSQLQALFADGLLIDSGQAGLFPLTFLLPLGVGLWELVRDMRRGSSVARLTGLLLFVTLLHWLAWPTFLGRWKPSELRHVQVVTPMLMMLAADGLVRLWRRSVVGRGLVLLLGAHFLLFVFLFQTLLVDVLAVAPPYDRADIRALRQLEPELGPEAVLMSRKPNRAAYYTDRAAVMMPLAGFKDLMSYARDHNVTHLVVQPRELRTRPGLAEGLDATSVSIPLSVEVGTVQIFEVRNYDFLPALEGDAVLDQEIDLSAPVPPPDWALLLQRVEPSTWSQTWETWRRLLGVQP